MTQNPRISRRYDASPGGAFESTPAPGTRPGGAQRESLVTQVEVHDSHQLEVRFNYAIGHEPGAQRYTVDTYFFVPKNVGLNRTNYPRDQFYADVTALMRLEAGALPLDHLADPAHPASPLGRLQAAVAALRSAPRPPPAHDVAVHVKLYAYLFTAGAKAELTRLTSLLKGLAVGAAEKGALERETTTSLARMREALEAFRRVRRAFSPLEQLAPDTLAEAVRASDEYMSLFLEERLALFVEALDREARWRDGSGYVARLRLAVGQLAREEADHRRRQGYVFLAASGLGHGEYFTYRTSFLKKAVQQALYLDPREVKTDKFIRNAAGGVAAALAAIWATALAMQIPGHVNAASGASWFVFTAAVLAYVMKDRIKVTANEYLNRRLRRYDHVSWLFGESLAAVGLGMMRARLREMMRFLSSTEVPDDVLSLRLSKRTVRTAEHAVEEVIHYRKQLEVGASQGETLPEGYWVRDILRLNVRHFLVRLDEPLDRVPYYDADRHAFASARLPKVYHLNLVVKLTRENADGDGQERLEHLRVVLNKDGIVRVEQVATRGPHPVAGERKRFQLPSRLR